MNWEEEKAKAQDLYDFLQGKVPKGYDLDPAYVPNLDAEQAWTAVWYLANLYWQVPDTIEKCDSCGELYHSAAEGAFKEKSEVPPGAPFGFRCDECAHQILDFEPGESP